MAFQLLNFALRYFISILLMKPLTKFFHLLNFMIYKLVKVLFILPLHFHYLLQNRFTVLKIIDVDVTSRVEVWISNTKWTQYEQKRFGRLV